ncbi:hypothetical protein PUR28_27820 [Streptomyces sp. BE308]|uniref:hypothetical protein n=1 Tax=Streptomyces sp. BE308 TaxID=3002529 RepID=UPI002E77A7CB|nr:hypothetical protein [Streptomyces sp. BE308]MEE1794537.1 hypothetical protein [Streptomyces sp. BE308]
MTPTPSSSPGPHHDGAPPWLHHVRARRQSVRATDFTRARQFVDRSGIVPLLRHEQQATRKSNAGRRRTVSLEALFIAMTLASWRDQGRVVLAEVTDILAHQLTPTARARLGLPVWADDADGFEAAYLAVRRAFHAAVTVMDPSPLPKQRLPRAEARRLEQEADQAQLAARRRLLVEVTNRIVEASLAPARPVIEEYWDGSAAVDATPIRTFSRGVSSTGPNTATDPDAAWYVREGNHRDPATTPQGGFPGSGKTKKKAKRYLFGFEATLVVTGETSTTPPGSAPASARDRSRHLPALVLAFVVHKPGHDPAGNAVTALRDMRRRTYPTGWLAADRAYNAALPEAFHIPVRDLGYRPVWDYRIDQLGVQDTHAGALLVDGTWYCPHIPHPLTTATADLLTKKIDKSTWRARVDARTSYRLRPKAAPDHRGARRMLCPAAGTHPTVACPVKRKSLGRDPRLPLIDPTPNPAGHPEICRRESLTFARDTGIRHWQELDHGRADWVHHYFRLRNRVEHFNGYAKDHEAIERSRTRRVRGLAAQSLLLSFQIAHANHRKLAGWLDTLQTDTQPARRRPSNRHTLNDPHRWTPHGYLPDATPET